MFDFYALIALILLFSGFLVTVHTIKKYCLMFDLGNPHYQYLLVLPLLILVTYFHLDHGEIKKQEQFADTVLFDKINPFRSKRKSVIKLILRILGLTALIVALINPKVGTRIETVTRKGVDVVFAIDVSKSMLAEDIAPSRILKAKQILSKAIDELVNDRIGIIVYAGKAYAQLPLTTDYTAAKMFLRTINTIWCLPKEQI